MRSGGDVAERFKRVARVGADALPGDGGAITLMVSDQARQTLTATDAVITAVEQAQLSVGEGPSLDAWSLRRPVLVSDVADSLARASWPGLAVPLAALDVGALYAFPMRLGVTTIGVALSYRRRPAVLDSSSVRFALRCVDLVTLSLLQAGESRPEEPDGPLRTEDRAGDGDNEGLGGDWIDGAESLGSRTVHQATGMAMVQLGGVSATTAFARMRAYAFANDNTLEEVADAIVARQLVLEPDPGAFP